MCSTRPSCDHPSPDTYATRRPPMSLMALPSTYTATRDELQRVATHVIARRRFAGCSKFGLRATPGGFGSPACGPDNETLRIAGIDLVRETTESTAATRSLRLS